MRTQGLSFENIPALHIPFRFFNTAPWMGVIAAIVLMCGSENTMLSHWTPTLLAVTHLLTLGFLSMVMLGALFQVLPVICGETLPYSSRVASLVHLFLLAGLLSLSLGFVQQNYPLFYLALPLLSLAFFGFLLSLGALLVQKLRGGESIFAIRLAAISLLITLGIGVLRAINYLHPNESLNLPSLTYLHIGWGLGGWVVLLIMAVSYQVIPMFHVTPNYSKLLARLMPGTVFVGLLALSFAQGKWAQRASLLLLCSVVIFYAAYSIWLLSKRKRKLRDVTVYFWRLALANLIIVSLLLLLAFFAHHWLQLTGFSQTLHILIGIIMIEGFACSVIFGMLQKIVPFLIYMHLQRQCLGDYALIKTLPHSRKIIPEYRSRWQFRLHLLTLALLVLALLFPPLLTLAALAMAIDFGWLGFCVASASRLYWQSGALLKKLARAA